MAEFQPMTKQGDIATGDSHTPGLLMGAGAVTCWSTTSAFLYLGARAIPVDLLILIASGSAGLLQLLFHRATGKPIRRCLLMPWKLALVMLLTFAAYELIYPLAYALCDTPQEALSVSLINYLWPALTVLLAVQLVPGVVFTRRLALAVALSLAGLFLANSHWLKEGQFLPSNPWPYLLSFLGAFQWAVYSALISRWKEWARHYATPPAAFLLAGVIAGGIALVRGTPLDLTPRQWMLALACGFIPYGTGYTLWELALHRAPPETLGMFAAAIPVSSTVLLALAQQRTPEPAIIIAAILIALAVLLSRRRSRRLG